MNIKTDILNVPKHDNKHDLIHLNDRTGFLCDEPMDCEGMDRYIDSLTGAEFDESQTNNIGRRFSLDKKTDSSGLRLLNICNGHAYELLMVASVLIKDKVISLIEVFLVKV